MSRQNNRVQAFFRSHISDNENVDPNSSNRATEEKHEWDTPTRQRVLTLREAGVSRTTIRKRTTVPERTQRLFEQYGPRRPGKNRPGAPKILSQMCLRTIIRFISKSFEARQSTWQQLANDYGGGCSGQTVKTALNSLGYRKCKACQMTYLTDSNVAERRSYCDTHKTHNYRYWRRIRFTDEVHFAIESRSAAWVIRDLFERCEPTCIQYKKRNKGSQIHAWGMVGYNYKGPLVFFDSNNTSKPTAFIYEVIGNEYDNPQPAKETEAGEAELLGDGRPSTCKHRCKNKQQCKHACCKPDYRSSKVAGNMTMEQYLTKIFHPYIGKAWLEAKEQHRGFILLEDNDGSHGTMTSTNIVARYKEKIGIPWIANAPRSPDLNIIENVWRILKQRLKQALSKRPGLTIDTVKDLIQQIWNDIDQKEINKLVDQMPERINECLRRKGMNTEY